mgnify:CR=1 FL=1
MTLEWHWVTFGTVGSLSALQQIALEAPVMSARCVDPALLHVISPVARSRMPDEPGTLPSGNFGWEIALSNGSSNELSSGLTLVAVEPPGHPNCYGYSKQ